MKIYISGKITGLRKEEFQPKFDAAENILREAGFTNIVNPTKLGISDTEDWSRAMNVCIPALETCDAIYMLDNWEESFGARWELHIAMQKKMRTMFGTADIPVCW